ncbi:hypothetical protein [Algoriphagus sediminis]|uniref:Membrane or secreted protein n=1 Tax=Algoriphagus sediminis TaxID=3057113 RepID=A0ABT7YCL5_9BACT|nr:hypothetical protein [Algoriphagus sediminis]MDN3204223.1 hypothetical protein [Algoriphagus sediminis]
MKNLLILTFVLAFSFAHAQDIEGAWKLTHQNGQMVTDMEYVKIIQDDYFSFGAKSLSDNHFVAAGGGPIEVDGEKYIETLDFFTLNPLQVGTATIFKLDMVDGKMVISANTDNGMLVEIWERIEGNSDQLTRNWVITGRKRNDEISRSTPGARRTIKILSGGRFQWVAFNSETKEFMGSGGGTYTAENGKYTENITFFSRDDSRVGASLEFDFEVIDGEWHHSGLSSRGDPIYEIWSPYETAYNPSN